MVIVTDAQNRLVGYLPLEEATEQFGEHLSCVHGFYKLDGTLPVEERQGWLRHSLESDELKDYQRDQVSEEMERIKPFVASERFARERAEAIERAKKNAGQRKVAAEEKAKEESAKAEQKKGSNRKAHTPVHPRRFHEEGGGVYLRTTRPIPDERRSENGQVRRGRKGKGRPSLSESIWPTPKTETMKLSRPTPTPKAVSTDGSAGMSGQSTQGSFSANKAKVVASSAPKLDSTEVVRVYDSGHAFLGYFSRMTAKDEWGIALSDDPELTVSRGFSLKGRKDILKRSMGNPLLDKMQKALIHSELGNIDGIERARAQEAERAEAERAEAECAAQAEAAAKPDVRERSANAVLVAAAAPVATGVLADGAAGAGPLPVEKDGPAESRASEGERVDSKVLHRVRCGDELLGYFSGLQVEQIWGVAAPKSGEVVLGGSFSVAQRYCYLQGCMENPALSRVRRNEVARVLKFLRRQVVRMVDANGNLVGFYQAPDLCDRSELKWLSDRECGMAEVISVRGRRKTLAKGIERLSGAGLAKGDVATAALREMREELVALGGKVPEVQAAPKGSPASEEVPGASEKRDEAPCEEAAREDTPGEEALDEAATQGEAVREGGPHEEAPQQKAAPVPASMSADEVAMGSLESSEAASVMIAKALRSEHYPKIVLDEVDRVVSNTVRAGRLGIMRRKLQVTLDRTHIKCVAVGGERCDLDGLLRQAFRGSEPHCVELAKLLARGVEHDFVNEGKLASPSHPEDDGRAPKGSAARTHSTMSDAKEVVAPAEVSADLAFLREWAAAQPRPVPLRPNDPATKTWFVANEIMHSRGDLLVFDEALYREVAGADLVDVTDPNMAESGVDILNFPFPMAVIRLDGDRDFFGVAVFRTDGFRRSLGLPVGSSDRVSSEAVYIPRVAGRGVAPGICTKNVAHKLMMYLNCEAISEQVVHRKTPASTRKASGGWDVSAAGSRASGSAASEVRTRRGGDYETGVHVIVERPRGQVTHPRGRLKRSHFRRGYYGYVWVGPRGLQHREMRWHRPTFVHGIMSSLAEHRVVSVAL